LLQIITRIGVEHFAGLGSDNTGNTKKAQRITKTTFPTIINFSDPMHHLNLTIGDITSLPEFKDVSSILLLIFSITDIDAGC
jgi:hypothetical protein